MEIDINSDVGESFGRYSLGTDEEVMKFISSANIACGFHAGDPKVMYKTILMAYNKEVCVGAHPGFYDLRGFGRKAIDVDMHDLLCDLIYQIGALDAFCKVAKVHLQHIKPHGALYNLAQKNEKIADTICEAICNYDSSLIIVTMANSAVERSAKKCNLKIAREIYGDRSYGDDGLPVPRSHPQAVIYEPEIVARRVCQMILEGKATTVSGNTIMVTGETVCIHGDNPKAPDILRVLRQTLEDKGIQIKPMAKILENRGT